MIKNFKSFINENYTELRYINNAIDRFIEDNDSHFSDGKDYVFELSDGRIVNIQFNEVGDKVDKIYDNGEDYTEWMGIRDINPTSYYKNFYNEHEPFDPFTFIGMADGYDSTLF